MIYTYICKRPEMATSRIHTVEIVQATKVGEFCTRWCSKTEECSYLFTAHIAQIVSNAKASDSSAAIVPHIIYRSPAGAPLEVLESWLKSTLNFLP